MAADEGEIVIIGRCGGRIVGDIECDVGVSGAGDCRIVCGSGLERTEVIGEQNGTSAVIVNVNWDRRRRKGVEIEQNLAAVGPTVGVSLFCLGVDANVRRRRLTAFFNPQRILNTGAKILCRGVIVFIEEYVARCSTANDVNRAGTEVAIIRRDAPLDRHESGQKVDATVRWVLVTTRFLTDRSFTVSEICMTSH
jgi:hypothetical protein